MARLEDCAEGMRKHLEELSCPSYENSPFIKGKPLNQSRLAVVSTAGIHHRDAKPFTFAPGDHYRVIPGDIQNKDIVMSHLSANFDRTGYQQDLNVVFPLDRLREMLQKREIGSLADFHYSFMGASDPAQFGDATHQVAGLLKKDGVDAVLLIPV